MSENRARKLIAAKKKLKEYRSKEKNFNTEIQFIQKDENKYSNTEPTLIIHNSTTIDGNSDESNYNAATAINTVGKSASGARDNTCVLMGTGVDVEIEELPRIIAGDVTGNSEKSLDAIQMLISEKATISSELIKYQTLCREKDLEIEEVQTRFKSVTKRMEDLEREFLEQQKQLVKYKDAIGELNILNTKARSQYDDQTEYLQELRNELGLEKSKNENLYKELKEKTAELELKKIRINQISDEASVSADNRIEILTQTKFMYEQQIRDLQTMVQQLEADKEQANLQYQTYVQHLNNEISMLSEKNSEINEDNAKLSARETSLIEHIGCLEKEIQQTIARQDYHLQENQKKESEAVHEIVSDLKSKIEELEEERLHYQLKIQSQEDKFVEMNILLDEKSKQIVALEEQVSEHPDSGKLYAIMESDKIAASRALTQNEELKNQLDEIQIKFVQLTNDKLELTNRLDSEEHANREIRGNYESVANQLKQLDEKLHFKDEEMIRLSHENNELTKKNFELQQQMDRLMHYEANEYQEKYIKQKKMMNEGNSELPNTNGESDTSSDGREMIQDTSSNVCSIPSTEAIEKLQIRFTKLMKEVAELTDEKQRLEHLVLQLQSETETIGEYIALYQTQRRILKQREYERTAQLHRLLAERDEIKTKMTNLNELFSNLGFNDSNMLSFLQRDEKSYVDNENENPFQENCLTKNKDIDISTVSNKNLTSNESKDLLSQIQNIISEIRTKDMPGTDSVDHCACCSGKFETV